MLPLVRFLCGEGKAKSLFCWRPPMEGDQESGRRGRRPAPAEEPDTTMGKLKNNDGWVKTSIGELETAISMFRIAMRKICTILGEFGFTCMCELGTKNE